ncbi:hypothetical protein EVAR_89484_1 [Eumeta japonica]|uniref:Uncharacterized protein n=1 Tax=Eumeta variegata TaxID=151549 RepID=A0A4C1XLR8_EUMVA|nr:hypothetical protein EVAR_89484_1 [Eumeta japonica]
MRATVDMSESADHCRCGGSSLRSHWLLVTSAMHGEVGRARDRCPIRLSRIGESRLNSLYVCERRLDAGICI